jgi:hypothetical protein
VTDMRFVVVGGAALRRLNGAPERFALTRAGGTYPPRRHRETRSLVTSHAGPLVRTAPSLPELGNSLHLGEGCLEVYCLYYDSPS